MEAGAIDTLVGMMKDKKNVQIKHYAAMVLVNMATKIDEFPSEIKALMQEGAKKTIIGKKLVDLVDGSHTAASTTH
jgi:hypothetical protein